MPRNKLTQFEKPSIEQIEAYFIEIGVQPAKAEAEKMWWHYEANGWRVGQTRMSSWKGACQTWKRSPYRQFQPQTPYQGRPGQNYAATGQSKRQIRYVTASNEQGTPMPDNLRDGLFGQIGAGLDKLVNKFTGKANDRPETGESSDPSRDNPEAGQG